MIWINLGLLFLDLLTLTELHHMNLISQLFDIVAGWQTAIIIDAVVWNWWLLLSHRIILRPCILPFEIQGQVVIFNCFHLLSFLIRDLGHIVFGHYTLWVVHHSIALHLLGLEVYVLYIHSGIVMIVSERYFH